MSFTIPVTAHQDDIMSTSVTSSIVEQSSSDIMEPQMNGHKFEAVALGTNESQETGRDNISIPDHKEDRKTTASSSESLPQLPEEMIIYLDDVEEVQQSVTKEVSCQDQRIFKFKSSVVPTDGIAEDSCDFSSSCSTSKKKKPVRKRTRRKSFSQQNSSVKDIEYLIYYNKAYTRSRSPGSHHHYKHLRKNAIQKSEHTFHEEKRQKQPHSCCCFNLEAECCCHPHYFYTDEDDQESPYPKQNDTIASAFNPVTNSDCQADKQSKVMKGKVEEFDALGGHFASNNSSPKERKAPKPPYLRAVTMPQERCKGNQTENMSRSSSFPIQSPNHVHPKLPNYEDIAAKFMALKKEHLQNRQQ